MKKILFSIYKKFAAMLLGSGISKYPFVNTIHKYVISHLKPNYIEIMGNKLFLDSEDFSFLSITSEYERNETELVKTEIKEGDFVVDIGANIGYYTLIFAKLVGRKGRVYAFEPEPHSFKLLKKNVEENKHQNIILEQKALGNKDGKVTMQLSNSNTEHRILYDEKSTSELIDVNSIRLDDYFRDLNSKINFIKMDAEGSEGKIIEGMSTLLQQNKILKIMTEFYPYLIKKSGMSPREFIELILKYDFKIYDIRKRNQTNLQELLQTYDSENKEMMYTYLLCTK